MPIQQRLKPKANVPEEVRTEGKDEAFESLEELRESGELYTETVEDIAERIGWSRAHVRSVFTEYYDRVDDTPTQETRENSTQSSSITLEIPPDVDTESYLRGYIHGKED